MERRMFFSHWVDEYKPIEGDSFINNIRWLGIDSQGNNVDPQGDNVIKKAKDLIGKYLIESPEDTYPDSHISMVCLESATSRAPFWYVVTRKPMDPIDKIIIIEQLDEKHTMKLYNFLAQII